MNRPTLRNVLNATDSGATIVGQGSLRYAASEGWLKLPEGWDLVEVAAVAIDSQDRVYVFNRGVRPVVVLRSDGGVLESWGEGMFVRPHGISIGPDDTIYCVDDLDHTLKRFSPDGRLLQKFGTSGQYSNTGATTVDYRTIRRAAGPFNFPTNVAFSPDGDLYISDGYGNARVHKFSRDGRLLLSWGETGDGPGQFNLPHGIAIDRHGIVYVADRENSRIQRFTLDGNYVDEWNDVARPCEVFVHSDGNVFVAELGYRAGMWPGTAPPSGNATGGRVSVFSSRGELLARWGGGQNPCAAGDFFAPHDIWVDSQGHVFVGEVTMSAGGNRGLVPRSCHCLQRFTPLPTAKAL